jgi:hypothetical protein
VGALGEGMMRPIYYFYDLYCIRTTAYILVGEIFHGWIPLRLPVNIWLIGIAEWDVLNGGLKRRAIQ